MNLLPVIGGPSGYVFNYTGLATTWSMAAAPESVGVTGDRWFFVDVSGAIRFSLTGPADVTSPPLD